MAHWNDTSERSGESRPTYEYIRTHTHTHKYTYRFICTRDQVSGHHPPHVCFKLPPLSLLTPSASSSSSSLSSSSSSTHHCPDAFQRGDPYPPESFTSFNVVSSAILPRLPSQSLRMVSRRFYPRHLVQLGWRLHTRRPTTTEHSALRPPNLHIP